MKDITVFDYINEDLDFEELTDKQKEQLISMIQKAQFVTLHRVNGYDRQDAIKYAKLYQGDVTDDLAAEFYTLFLPNA